MCMTYVISLYIIGLNIVDKRVKRVTIHVYKMQGVKIRYKCNDRIIIDMCHVFSGQKYCINGNRV